MTANLADTHDFYDYVLYLEAQDDGPDETEGQSGAAVHNVLCSHVLQLHLGTAKWELLVFSINISTRYFKGNLWKSCLPIFQLVEL